jgi:hypothetical protein
MELLPGESLSQVRRAQPARRASIDTALCAWVGAEIAEALYHGSAVTDVEGYAPCDVL